MRSALHSAFGIATAFIEGEGRKKKKKKEAEKDKDETGRRL
jgi:hypothetical protein